MRAGATRGCRRFARPWAPRPCASASTPAFICCGGCRRAGTRGRWSAGRKADVGVQDVAEFARKATPAPGVVIGYSAVDEARLRRLGALLAALRPGRVRG